MGNIVKATITRIVDFGAFCDAEINDKTYKCLIHISELADKFIANIEDYVKVGDKVDAYVISVDNDKSQAKLSLRKVEK